MIACLPMYDRPETAAAHDAFWQAIRAELGQGPEALSRDIADLWPIWRAPDLVLAQTCGLPYRARLYGDVELVGTPDYGLPGCPPGYFNSVLIARADQMGAAFTSFAGSRFAYNDPLSQSGWAAAMMRMRADNMLPGELLETGSHRASAEAVAAGRADFAALDALSYQMLQDYEPDLMAQLCELERTEPTPGLPFITALGQDPAAILAAMQAALEKLSPAHRDTLHIKEILPLTPSDYLAVPTPPGPTLIMDRLARER
ncbi:phosphate/phosphite/phosphonate ABC transporter substrate-binding protein [Phaeobacter sp. HF9A]|uniref:phosphate/phosphite/phosphonate ABC transporter substrate-binding protein n=1 Tax=Phaeobacter sp. HF9A TaxID=2721561 RepID=UPI001431628E|nr:PhnD/SsuA/transferrin family substrate-binding protein [Phaeobacter sp. HF9A]NIZ15221.1 PhnD/SsuA/transferrin family substrate-binding protein [Phaeobacter sp. HF9A]